MKRGKIHTSKKDVAKKNIEMVNGCMIDLHFLRDNPEVVRTSLRKRKDTEKLAWVDEILKKSEKEKEIRLNVDSLRHRRNVLSKKINEMKKKGQDISLLLEEVKGLPEQIKTLDKELDTIRSRIRYLLMRMPNILHDSVPYGEGEEDNKVVRTWGTPRKDIVKNHYDWGIEHNYIDTERAAKTSGSRFYFLKGKLVTLQMGLIQYAWDIVKKHNFNLYHPPFLVRRRVIEGSTDLSEFEDVMYGISDEDLYLVSTAEHPLIGYYMNETFDESQLPVPILSISPGFRKEAGSHGKDTKGIFRVHQFQNVEMVVFSSPEESWEWHERLLSIEEEIVQGLGIPYRIVNVCTGDIGIVAAKKYDVEAWMPASQKYREIMSCSNCTNYQAVRSNIRLKRKKGLKDWVHTLNATALADTRMMVAIIENYMQKDESVEVPKNLRKYVDFEVLE